MKKTILAIIAVFLLSMSAPLLAEDMTNKAHNMGDEKDQCLLYSKKCKDNVDSLQEKINKLNNEISKGTITYKPEEIKRLDEKLKEANDLLDVITNKQGSSN